MTKDNYEQTLASAVGQIHSIVSKLPSADALTVLRFIPSRHGEKTEDVLTAWAGDRAARADAEQQRLDKLRRALEGAQPGDVEVVLKGVSAKAETGSIN